MFTIISIMFVGIGIGYVGWQAAILATLSILGSMLASFLVFHLFFKKGGKQ